ncbi:uncharacterized protein LOC107883195 [Acyrthosiphon pisum]|uniref:THAP-type domain-containing protein n=1 Tax=Acyrthosiphon pisum TaxID=7029 RepID=A0A8R2D2L6_ACYPI|nr:uncharacterized protein LOC107883195 [Acyrthosiphon pisum]|eukprot:XP_016658287.1 PREDICTED: uncharacterized protein LOC107883195 [Acyrthosiphon pisum]
MGGCTAPNCSNSRKNKIKLFRFPREKSRKDIWVQNCSYAKYTLKKVSLSYIAKMGLSNLSLMPFQHFNVSNPPARLDTKRKSVYKNTAMKTTNISSTTTTSLSQSDACFNITENSVNTVMKTTNISSSKIMSLSQSDACVNIIDNSVCSYS